MKTKKTTTVTLLLAAALVAGTVTVFATSAQAETNGSHPAPQTNTQATESGSDAAPDPELLAAGLTYRNNSWYYQGKAVAGMYDDNGGIYTDDASADGIYLAVKRGSDGKITEFSPITQKEFRELVDRHMNLFLTETDTDNNTLMSYMDPTDGKTYYSFDDGKTFEPLTDAEFEARFPTPDIEWWTYDEYKAWLEQEKVQLQSIIGETDRINGKEFTWTQEEIDKTIAMYEETLEDIKNGILYSKSVDGQEEVIVSFNPADVAIGTSTNAKELCVKLDNGTEKTFGPYETDEELLDAVTAYCDEQVRQGKLSQSEADELIRAAQPENPGTALSA